MANIKLPQEVIDKIASAEARALMEGLKDPEQMKNPAFLGKVRQFLKDNNFITTTETDGVQEVIQDASKIPEFEDLVQ